MREAVKRNRTFADLSRYIRKSPSWSNYILPITIVLTIDYVLIKNILVVLVGILGSYFLVIFLDMIFARYSRFSFPTRRILFLNFLSLLIWSLFFWIIYFTKLFSDIESMLMISISSAALLRILIFYVYYSEKNLKAIVPSLSYTYSAIVTLTLVYHDPITVFPFVISSVVYVVAGLVFAKSSTRKFAEEFGEDPTKLIQFFLNFQSSDDSKEIGEKFFNKMYQHTRKIPVKVLDVLSKNGKRKVALIFPYIHPGPFATLGSSDLPNRLQSRLAELDSDLMVFHTTTTNSNNCSGDKDIDAIAEGIREAIKKVSYVSEMSRFKKIIIGKYVVGMVKFGPYGIGSLIPEKTPFDDVSLKEGLKLMHSIEKAGAKDFAAIDAQNFFYHGAPELNDCSGITDGLVREFNRLQSKFPARIGYARVNPNLQGLAAMGIQAIVMELNGKYHAIVLTDSNNITSELIELSREKAADMVSSLEIYTSDNHYVNANTLDMNPLGERGNLQEISEAILKTVANAKEDVEDVQVGMATENVKVRMGDDNSFENLLNIVFSSVRRAKYTILITIPSSVFASIMIFRMMAPFF